MASQTLRTRAPRAVTPEQKVERRRAIVSGAESHFRAVGFEDFSMEVLAKQLGIARGTLYRYFETREELLLELYEQQRDAWCGGLIASLTPQMSDTDFVECFLDQTREVPLFLDLSARLESVIEHNVSIDRLVASKGKMHDVMTRMTNRVATCLELTAPQASRLLVGLATLLLGAVQLDVGPPLEDTNLPPEVREMVNAFSGDDVFRWNARLILEATRRLASNEVASS